MRPLLVKMVNISVAAFYRNHPVSASESVQPLTFLSGLNCFTTVPRLKDKAENDSPSNSMENC